MQHCQQYVHCKSGIVPLQVFAKEEELAEFQARLGEREAALKAYKTENSRFADMKDKFKADIASLQLQVYTFVTVLINVCGGIRALHDISYSVTSFLWPKSRVGYRREHRSMQMT